MKNQNLSILTIQKILSNARHALKIADQCKTNENGLYFTYLAFIRLGVTIMPVLKHEIKNEDKYDKTIINKLSKVLHKKYIKDTGQKMKQKIDNTIYGFAPVSQKELSKYSEFVNKVLVETEKYHLQSKPLFFK